MRVIAPQDPDFDQIKEITCSRRNRYDYDKLSRQIKHCARTSEDDTPKVLVDYPHISLSNLVNALKRRGLFHMNDYRITRVPQQDNMPEQIIIEPSSDLIETQKQMPSSA